MTQVRSRLANHVMRLTAKSNFSRRLIRLIFRSHERSDEAEGRGNAGREGWWLEEDSESPWDWFRGSCMQIVAV
jgi:hypothetical protein